jgi:hypothetical protein
MKKTGDSCTKAFALEEELPPNCEAKPCRFLKFFNSYPEESFSGLQFM